MDADEQMAALREAVAEAKARRAREARDRMVRPTRTVGRAVRLREYTKAEVEEQAAIDEYEMSGRAWADAFAAKPDERLSFRESPGLDPRRGLPS